MKKKSRMPEFFKLSRKERIKRVIRFAGLSQKEAKVIAKNDFNLKDLEKISENVIATFSLPYSVATNFLINKKDYLVPMVTEEASVVAAACFGAKLCRDGGGIFSKSLGNVMIGQIYSESLKSPETAKKKILKEKKYILSFANKQDLGLMKAGGRVKDLEVKIFNKTKIGSFLRIHLLIDVKDAMGANAVNSISEKTADFIERKIGIKTVLKIVSNLAENRLVRVKTIVTKKALQEQGFNSKETIDKIVRAYKIAEIDAFRAVTNNKGILNGMAAVVLATGNDWRALEAGVHSYAVKKGKYQPLANWEKDSQGNLKGEMTVPVMVGTVGGITQKHSLAEISLKILGVKKAVELAQIIAAVGLAQNLAALRALALEGIQKGHMKLHNRKNG